MLLCADVPRSGKVVLDINSNTRWRRRRLLVGSLDSFGYGYIEFWAAACRRQKRRRYACVCGMIVSLAASYKLIRTPTVCHLMMMIAMRPSNDDDTKSGGGGGSRRHTYEHTQCT